MLYEVITVDVEEYDINGYDSFYGFVAGMFAGNFDISEVFVDSILKIVGKDFDMLGTLFEKIEKISKEIKVVFTVSADESELPESVKKYL